MGRMKYVQRRANRYEFRFPLPDDLAGQPVPLNEGAGSCVPSCQGGGIC